ncbi:hypothetical protein [Streptomyces sp. NPDC088733]|uniref:hypothetical protein n=1 Tax=Streptomyces sp. NPDC088733 TaxID=3365880 RepID=UPI00382E6705
MMRMLADGSSETFWTALGAVAAVLAIPTAVMLGWLSYRAVWPRRTIEWSASISPLVHGAAHTSRLTVEFSGTRLRHPHIVEVHLLNEGKKDIEPAHFSGHPIEITSTGRVVGVLQQLSSPGRRPFNTTEHPNRVELDPSTPLHSKQVLRYVFLVDGPDPEIDIIASTLNCDLKRIESLDVQIARNSRRRMRMLLLLNAFLALSCVTTALIAVNRLPHR